MQGQNQKYQIGQYKGHEVNDVYCPAWKSLLSLMLSPERGIPESLKSLPGWEDHMIIISSAKFLTLNEPALVGF